jgi:diadenosine tetraphosphate (Ap4A) HIT family hydrolase
VLSAIICADWSKVSARRAAYVADVATRTVRCLGKGPFTLTSVLRAASRIDGSVLVGIDAPLGAPRSLLAATHSDLGVSPDATFIQWVRKAALWPEFFTRAVEAEPWSPLRPFFRVSPGADARNSRFREMKARGVDPLRVVDTVTAAKSPFILSGIPGSVGSSVVDLWPALASVLADSTLRVWPFDETEPDAGEPGIVLAEIYPRAMYALALAPEPPAQRARMRVDKSDRDTRRGAVESLLDQEWVGRFGVRFEDADADMLTEDAFDALVSAAGALRCVLEGTPLGCAGADPFEGGIVGLDSLNLSLPERTFRSGAGKATATSLDTSPFLERPAREWIASNDLAFAIPDGFPVSPGHTLVVTRRVVATWFDASRYERMAILDLVDEVKALLDAREPKPDGYNIGWNVGVASGQTVAHLHVHVIPRYAGDVEDPTGGVRGIIPGKGNYRRR